VTARNCNGCGLPLQPEPGEPDWKFGRRGCCRRKSCQETARRAAASSGGQRASVPGHREMTPLRDWPDGVRFADVRVRDFGRVPMRPETMPGRGGGAAAACVDGTVSGRRP
jgi:hypothetical protein